MALPCARLIGGLSGGKYFIVLFHVSGNLDQFGGVLFLGGKFHQNYFFCTPVTPNNSYYISCEESHETDTDDRRQLTMLLHVENN